jgi:hypothetical protein
LSGFGQMLLLRTFIEEAEPSLRRGSRVKMKKIE